MKRLMFFTALITMYFLIGLFTSVFAQSDRLVTGILSSSLTTDYDSTVTFYSAGKEWVYIFLVDSTGAADSALVGIKNPINDNYTILGVKDQYNEDFVNVIVPGVDVRGRLYVIWVLYPGNIELRRTNIYDNALERLSYSIFTKGTSE